jgi:hypothetical protein
MMRFTDLSLDKFWISVKEEYPAMHNILLQFATSYMCKQAFSCLTSIKSKDRNCLTSVEDKYLDPELSMCAAKNKNRLSIKRSKFHS